MTQKIAREKYLLRKINYRARYVLMRISAKQCRAARAALEFSREGLAAAAGVSLASIERFERGKGSPEAKTSDAIEAALVRAGVQFVHGVKFVAVGDGAEGVIVSAK